MRLGRAPVELHEALDRRLEVSGVEPVEGLRFDGRLGEHLLREPQEEPAVARLFEGIDDRQVGDCRREQHCAVGLLRPQVAEDRVGRLGVLEVVDESLDAIARPAVDLADVEGALAAEEDPPRGEVVRAKVDEGADRALRADDVGDHGLVDAVLKRDDEAVFGEPRSDRAECRLRVVCLDGEQDGAEALREVVRKRRRRAHAELLDRPLDRQPIAFDRRYVQRIRVAEEDVVAVARQPGADGAADRSRADHYVLHFRDAPTSQVASERAAVSMATPSDPFAFEVTAAHRSA